MKALTVTKLFFFQKIGRRCRWWHHSFLPKDWTKIQMMTANFSSQNWRWVPNLMRRTILHRDLMFMLVVTSIRFPHRVCVKLTALSQQRLLSANMIFFNNRTVHIRHQCRKTKVLSCHRCVINSGVKNWTTFKYRLELWQPDVSK